MLLFRPAFAVCYTRHMKSNRPSGKLRTEPSNDFARVCRVWQSGDISTSEVARRLGVSRYTFYCWLSLSGITEFPKERNWRKIKQPASFPRIYEAWKRKEMHWSEAVKELGVSQSTFYVWASAYSGEPSAQKRRRKRQPKRVNMEIPHNFPRFYEQWKSEKMNYKVILETFHIGRSTFYRWVVEYEQSLEAMDIKVRCRPESKNSTRSA